VWVVLLGVVEGFVVLFVDGSEFGVVEDVEVGCLDDCV